MTTEIRKLIEAKEALGAQYDANRSRANLRKLGEAKQAEVKARIEAIACFWRPLKDAKGPSEEEDDILDQIFELCGKQGRLHRGLHHGGCGTSSGDNVACHQHADVRGQRDDRAVIGPTAVSMREMSIENANITLSKSRRGSRGLGPAEARPRRFWSRLSEVGLRNPTRMGPVPIEKARG
jgi:hypothetical protein